MVLLIGPTWRPTEEDIKTLLSLGHEVHFVKDEREALPIPYEDVEGVVCNNLFLFHDIKKFKNLHYVQLTSAGLDRAPVDYITECGITLHNARGVYSIPMAEHTLLSVLALFRRFDRFVINKAEKRYEKVRDVIELHSKRVLTVGCGSVGRCCAERFAAMGCTVFGVDDFAECAPPYERLYKASELDAALESADVVILSLPYTPETHHIMNADRLARLPDGATVVNISRGGTLDTEALIGALQSGRLTGAVLDVFEEEPLPASSPLWELDNLIITPHNSFVGEGNARRLSKLVIENLEKVK
ncbi:MAG: hydroxyacid dehydrogenase [Clostridia bacterium]|nr:hydroxyacid dehydrogenase [Clostridia bacterium]